MFPDYKRVLARPDRSFFLFGPRGVGKSTWLKQNFEDSLWINLLDEALFQSYLRDVSLFAQRLAALDPGSWVVVDEVQRMPELLNEVHRHIESRGLKFALSGSSARKLRRAGVNLLAGRAVRRELHPLLPEELGKDFSLERVLETGSLALIWNQGSDREGLEAYVQTYLKEEIQAEALVRNLSGFARFLPVAALFHGQVLNAASLARDAGIARTTVLGYLEILEDTLLGFRLAPYEGKLRVKEKRHPKLYWVDAGIARAARQRFGAVAEEERGVLFEGFIATVLRAYKSYRQLFDEWNYWAPTQSDALEVDFLLWRQDRCVAIEVKATPRFRPEHCKGLRALAASMTPGTLVRSIVVYTGDARLRTDDGIDVLPLREFLDAVETNTLGFENAQIRNASATSKATRSSPSRKKR